MSLFGTEGYSLFFSSLEIHFRLEKNIQWLDKVYLIQEGYATSGEKLYIRYYNSTLKIILCYVTNSNRKIYAPEHDIKNIIWQIAWFIMYFFVMPTTSQNTC